MVQNWPAGITSDGACALGNFVGWKVRVISGNECKVMGCSDEIGLPIPGTTEWYTLTAEHNPDFVNGIRIGNYIPSYNGPVTVELCEPE